MNFIDRVEKHKEEAVKQGALQLLRDLGITLQELEAVTSVDFNFWQRVFDLTKDYPPPLCLPVLLKGKGEKFEKFAQGILQIINAPYEQVDTKKLNGSIADDVIVIVEKVGKISEAERENRTDKHIVIEQQLLEIRERVRLIYEEIHK